MVSAEREPITRVWGKAPKGSKERVSDQGSGSEALLKLDAF